MRAGWNPTRRNRHIGTEVQGHGVANRFTIPESWHDGRCYFEKLQSFQVVTRTIGARQIRFFVEPTRRDYFYPCSIDDLCAVLTHCRAESIQAFDLIVLRQPTRKQRILAPVWGRAIFQFEIDEYSGPAIVIEAQNLDPIVMGAAIGPERMREVARLRRDGHVVRKTRRGVEVQVSPTSLRNTVLYRTLLHELGHHIDYQRSSSDEWTGKTRSAKEDFAHRYAHEVYEALAKQGVLPFAAIVNEQSLLSDKLKQEWFSTAKA